jgi:hypothetical protein
MDRSVAVMGDLAVQVLDDIVAMPVFTVMVVVVVVVVVVVMIVRHILEVCGTCRYGEILVVSGSVVWTD